MPFTDAYERTIDAKNRVQIPAQFRAEMEAESLGEALFLCPGQGGSTLCLIPDNTFKTVAKQLPTEQLVGDDPVAFEQMYYSLASKLEMDKQGRVVLPERQLKVVNLGTEIVLAGANLRIDIWAKADYRKFVETAFATRWSSLQKYMRQAPDRGAGA